ncbi:MAG TPA: tRNA (adenosine(37)-N6)-threonylcarbamoyltransferase complex ATPase subunit type 1 TsaE [Chloroflexota bacterium]|nr:tRNA (adenosine(37)-N6)-threonylcarbamoyltransferase complex ATPase subunit type 1 TsaE [Chloroflexota bacterium]
MPTAEHMRQLGAAFGQAAMAGDRFLLHGPFGAGKTTFVQGLARGLGVETPVASPSFVIETQYRGRLPLYHIDLYRLNRIEPELLEELQEHLYGDGVAAVEWAERLPSVLEADGALLRFQIDLDDVRTVTVSSNDERIARAAAAA